MQTRIKCRQINLQHSRIRTDNLMKIIEDSADILYIQETYTIQTKMAGILQNTNYLYQEKEVFGQL